MIGNGDSARENIVSGKIVDAAIEVHKELKGPDLLESVYEEALVYELISRKCLVERQKVVTTRKPGVYAHRSGCGGCVLLRDAW